MGEASKISWTDDTFNPWVGCMKVSAGCKHCYAEALDHRWGRDHRWGPNSVRERTSEANWRKPIKWNREAEEQGTQRLVFCASLADVFEDHPQLDAMRADLWPLIRSTPHLTWQLLTKRAARIRECLPDDWGDGYPNVWLGTSVESMVVAERADYLRKIPALVHFISYEPALGPLTTRFNLTQIDWIIYGGESGPQRRDHDPAWARAIRDRCAKGGKAFWYKQGSGPKPGMEDTLDGERIQQLPERGMPRPRYRREQAA